MLRVGEGPLWAKHPAGNIYCQEEEMYKTVLSNMLQVAHGNVYMKIQLLYLRVFNECHDSSRLKFRKDSTVSEKYDFIMLVAKTEITQTNKLSPFAVREM